MGYAWRVQMAAHAMTSFVAPFLRGGVSSRDARRIFDSLRAQSGEIDPAARRALVEVSELYGDFFTVGGAKKWQKLTGISIARGNVSYPKGFMPEQNLIELRGTLAARAKAA